MVVTSGSIEKNDQHCLEAQFLHPGFLPPGKIDSTPLSFRFRIEFEAATFSPVVILRNTSRSSPTISMKLRQHSIWFSLSLSLSLSLSVQSLRGTVQTWKQFSSSEKLFPKFAWLLPCRLQDVQGIVWRLFACTATKWLEISPRFHWTDRKLVALKREHSPAIPCLLENARTIARLVHDSVSHHRTHV
jgi:hypothetical protein